MTSCKILVVVGVGETLRDGRKNGAAGRAVEVSELIIGGQTLARLHVWKRPGTSATTVDIYTRKNTSKLTTSSPAVGSMVYGVVITMPTTLKSYAKTVTKKLQTLKENKD